MRSRVRILAERVATMDMDDVLEMIKSFLLNLVISFVFCLVCFFLLKWFATWYDGKLSKTATNLLLIVIPLGFSLFATTGNNFVAKIIRIIGLLTIVVPTLLHHLDLINIVKSGNDISAPVEFVILPIAWIASVMTYIQIGYEIWDEWAKFSLGYVFVIANVINFIFLPLMGIGVAIFYLIAGCVALVYLGIIRIKEGSAFEY